MNNQNKKYEEENKRLKKEKRKLEKELQRKEKALAEMSALLVLKKKADTFWGGQRGRLIPQQERIYAITIIDEAVVSGARRHKATAVLGISLRTFWRWKKNECGDKRKGAIKKIPRKLSSDEQQEIIEVCCSPLYRDKTPYDIYYTLLEDENRYIGSISTMYRILKAQNKIHHRGKSKHRKARRKPPEVVATGPNQVWCWDISYIQSAIRGEYFYKYSIIDIWDRSIVGYEVHDREDEKYAFELFRRMERIHGISGVHIHSDNGHPMKGMSLLSFLYSLKVTVTRSRPRTSNDNPFIESFFKTMKYSVVYPNYFRDIHSARRWMADFVNWYNTEHRHSGINFVTPQQMRNGNYKNLFHRRNNAIQKAYNKKPFRWSSKPKQWNLDYLVYLNPSLETQQKLKEKTA